MNDNLKYEILDLLNDINFTTLNSIVEGRMDNEMAMEIMSHCLNLAEILTTYCEKPKLCKAMVRADYKDVLDDNKKLRFKYN